MHKRRVHIIGVVVSGLILLPAVFLLFERVRGQITLSSYRRELVARGEKVTPEEFGVAVPEVDNGAARFTESAQALTQGAASLQRYPPRMKLLPSGRALVGYREDQWLEEKTVHRWEQLEPQIRTNAARLARIQAALEMPRFNHSLDYSLGVSLPLKHLLPAKSMSSWFGVACQLALREGNSSDVRANLIALVRLSRVSEEDRLIISELVRVAIVKIARTSLWEALQSDRLTEADLLEVQRAWTRLTLLPNLARSLEGERVYGDRSFEMLHESYERVVAVFDSFAGMDEMFKGYAGRSDWQGDLEGIPYGEEVAAWSKRHIYTRIWSFAWAHHNQVHSMMDLQRLTELARRGVLGKSYAALRPEVELLEAETARNGFYDRLRFPLETPLLNLSSSIRRGMEAECERSLALSAIGLKRFVLQHGRLPDTLDALVPDFLSEVPTDYMDGKPIRYRLRDDGDFTLYSVGTDGVDDGGDGSPSDKPDNLYQVDRKDLVWPSVARPDEVEAFRKELSNGRP